MSQRTLREQIKRALAVRRAAGRRISRFARFGFKFGPGDTLLEVPGEQFTIQRILELRASDLTMREISARLTQEGHLGRCGHPLGTSTISTIIRRAQQ